MHIGQAQLAQFAHHVVKQRLWVLVHDVVGGVTGEANAGAAAADFIDDGAGRFQQQACAVLDAAAVVVGALVGAVFRNWSIR